MDIRPIRNEADYNWALKEIEVYFDNEPESGTPEADRFDVLAGLIEAYEANYWDIEAPDPIEAILTVMEATGRTQADLAELLSSRPRASEIISRKRRLNLAMIQKLSEAWKIPAALLIKPYHLAAQRD